MSNILSVSRLSTGLQMLTNQPDKLKMFAKCDDAIHNLELIRGRMTVTSVLLTPDEAAILLESYE